MWLLNSTKSWLDKWWVIHIFDIWHIFKRWHMTKFGRLQNLVLQTKQNFQKALQNLPSSPRNHRRTIHMFIVFQQSHLGISYLQRKHLHRLYMWFSLFNEFIWKQTTCDPWLIFEIKKMFSSSLKLWSRQKNQRKIFFCKRILP